MFMNANVAKMKNSQITPFDYLKALFTKTELPGKPGQFEFIATRYLSMYPNTILEAINAAQYLGKIRPEIYGRVLYLTVPKEKPSPFIKYIKKPKEPTIDKILLGKVCKSYHCNEKTGREIIEIAKAKKYKLKKEFGLK